MGNLFTYNGSSLTQIVTIILKKIQPIHTLKNKREKVSKVYKAVGRIERKGRQKRGWVYFTYFFPYFLGVRDSSINPVVATFTIADVRVILIQIGPTQYWCWWAWLTNSSPIWILPDIQKYLLLHLQLHLCYIFKLISLTNLLKL